MNLDNAENGRDFPRDGLLVRDLDGELVILDTELDRIHQLNSTAGIIWRKIAEGATQEEAAAMLERDFLLDAVTARRDVGETVNKFRELGFFASGERVAGHV